MHPCFQGEIVWEGNKTEQGLLRFVLKNLDCDYNAIRHQFNRASKKQWPFNSSKKRMSTIVLKGGQGIIYVKGLS